MGWCNPPVVPPPGNAASILAVSDPTVGLAVAYPIMQCGLAVAGLWGVLLFREITGEPPAAAPALNCASPEALPS